MSELVVGLENLDSVDRLLAGRRVGLVSHAAATDSTLTTAVDVLAARYDLRALFGPEHGIRGDVDAGDHVGTHTDALTGLPVYSLYGASYAPTPEQLSGIDVLAVDLQDAGSRYYTYLSTLAHVMEAAAALSVPVVVMDRPNPLGGEVIEGTLLDRRFASFVGRFPVPARHGLTIGEYARLINETERIGADLHIAPVRGWQRSRYFGDLGLQWVLPSPNLPTPSSALAYVGTCLLEGTNVSEGRGTTRPFEIFGAPWIDQRRVRSALPAQAVEGVVLRECWFKPHSSKHAGQLCAGFEIHVAERDAFRPYRTGVALLDAIRRTHREFQFRSPAEEGVPYFIDLLSGDDALRSPDFSLSDYLERCRSDSQAFAESRREHLLYA